MKRSKMQDSLLALLGLAAVAVYVLACRPSFSPDGARIVFPSIDTDAKQAAILCYDLKEKTLETVYRHIRVPQVREPETPADPKKPAGAKSEPSLFYGSSSEQSLHAVQWHADGRRVVINALSYIMVLPVGAAAPARMLQLEHALDAGVLMNPQPVLGRYQYLTDKKLILRVDLDTGAILSKAAGAESVLFGQDGRLFYYSNVEAGDKPDHMEIGILDPETLAMAPQIRLGAEECGEISGFAAMARDGSRLALTTRIKDSPAMLLFRGQKVEKILAVAEGRNGVNAGNAEWALDGKTLFVAYTREFPGKDSCQYGVMEMPVDRGSPRDIPLFSGGCSDDSVILFQIALSPNGRTLAANGACLEAKDLKGEHRALYLIDLADPARRVIQVPVPSASAGGTAGVKR